MSKPVKKARLGNNSSDFNDVEMQVSAVKSATEKNQKEIKKAPETKSKGRVLYNWDDSSDGEIVGEAVKTYDFEEQQKSFHAREQMDQETKERMSNVLLMHAVGTGVLYSPQVGFKYYGFSEVDLPAKQGLKEKYLSSFIDDQRLQEIISSGTARTLQVFFGEVEEKVKEEFHSKLAMSLAKSDTFQGLIKEVMAGSAKTYVENGSLRILDSAGNNFFDLLAAAVTGTFQEVPKLKRSVNPAAGVSTFYRRALEAVIPHLKEAGIVKDNPTYSSKKDSPYRVADRGRDVSEVTKASPKFPKKTYDKIMGLIKGSKVTKFETILEENEAEIAQAFAQDCAVNDVLFQDQVRQNMTEGFLAQARKDLPEAFQSQKIEDVTGLLAHIRLSNRSATRKIKNLESTVQQMGDEYDDFYDLRVESSNTRVWNIQGVPVREKQSVDAGKTRVDLVFEADAAKGGKYKALHEKFIALGLDDKTFARLIRANLGSKEDGIDPELLKNKEVKQFVAKVTYLIFGCEVARNPASLVANQMMLDLIISGQKTWENFFVDTEMPMAPEGAVAQARALHSVLKDYMPWPYKYEGKEADYTKLAEAENSLLKEWLKSKKIDPKFAKEAVIMACASWYEGVNMIDVVYAGDKAPEIARVSKLVVERLEKGEAAKEELKVFNFLKDKKLLNDEALVKVDVAKEAKEEEVKEEKQPLKKAEKPSASPHTAGKEKKKLVPSTHLHE